MRRIRTFALFACLAWAVHASVTAAPDAPAAAASALQSKEAAARTKAADEMTSLAKSCVMYSAYDDARQAYAKAIAIAPPSGGDAIRAELEKIKDKTGAPAAGATAQIADRRTKALAKCADLLAPAAAAYAQADRADDLVRMVALMRSQGMAVDAPLAKLDVVWFEPYLEWHRKKDADKLQLGWEIVDGAWLDPAKVAAENAAHAKWTDPWVVADDVHEVRTTLPLRTAKLVLAKVASFRRFFLGYFAGEWDLEPPPAKLTVFLAGTRAELDERVHEIWPDIKSYPSPWPGYYLTSTRVGNPCFVAFEMPGPGGSLIKADMTAVEWTLKHDLTKQLAYEFSKHAADLSRLSRGQTWAVEGLAELMPYYSLVDGTWVVTHPKQVEMSGGGFEGAFAYCRANVARIPPLGQFIALTRDKFQAIENYQIAATLTWFLLEGKDRAYRPNFVKVLQTVHQCREQDDTFVKCFEGVHNLDADFRAFCKGIKLDGK